MQLLSIQVGKVQTHQHNGADWTTAYFKQPMTGKVYVNRLNVEGDQQHHLKFHGGEHRAVLMYSAENYKLLEDELGKSLPYGSFAENFTVAGLNEDTVCIGDIFQIGQTVQVQVAQPRQPCNQIYRALGIRGIVNKIKASHYSGWYLRVLEEGYVEAGMPITLLDRPNLQWTVARAHQVRDNFKDRAEEALELSTIETLEPSWRKKLLQARKYLGGSIL